MRRAVERLKQNNKKTTFILQLTVMVDMFTIMIVFLLKSYSTSAVHITPQKGLKLPSSASYSQPVEALKLIVALDGVYVDDNQVLKMDNGKLTTAELDPNDDDFIKPLYEKLNEIAEKSKAIADVNEEHEFEGKVVMQADSRLNYKTLKKVMYTASMAGYADMRLATIAFE